MDLIHQYGPWIIAGAALGLLLFKDRAILKQLQTIAAECAGELKKLGLDLLADILIDFSQLDFKKLIADFKHAVNVMKNPVTRRAHFAQVVATMIKEELGDKKTGQAFLDGVMKEALAAGLKPSPTTAAAA